MDWAAFLKEYGLPVTILFLFVGAIVKGYLVPGQTHADVKDQRDRALNMVYRMADELNEQEHPLVPATTTPTAKPAHQRRRGAEDV